MDKRIIDLLDLYFENGHLNSFQMEELISLASSEQEAVNLLELMSDFSVGMEAFGNNELKKELNNLSLEVEVDAESAPQDYTSIPEAALKTYFAGQPMYSSLMQSSSRSLLLVFEAPENGFEWNKESIVFNLQNKVNGALTYKIENNQGESLLNGHCKIEESKFAINFDWKFHLPGRYYLKLIVDQSLTVFEFFIRKDLMPD